MSPVVQQDQVKLIGSVEFVRAPRTGHKGRVRAYALTRPTERGLLEDESQVLPCGYDLVYPNDGYMNRRERRCHAGVSLIRDEDQGSGLRDEEVPPSDAHVGAQEFLTHLVSREESQFVRARAASAFSAEGVCLRIKEGKHLLASLVRGGHEDVGWVLAGELDDVLAQVRLTYVKSVRLELAVEFDLFGSHRLGLDNPMCPAAVRDFENLPTDIGWP